MKQKLSSLIIAAIILAACSSPAKKAEDNITTDTTQTLANAPSATDSAAIYDQLLVSDANELNSQCPIMVDKETRLDNAQPMTKDNTLRYNYTLINREKKLFKDIPKVKERMTPGLINVVRTNPDMEIYKQHKTTLEYYYKDKNGEFLFNILITPELYEDK